MVSFNSAQQRAVEHADGPLLVLAGPGSGKTRVLVGRVAQLIERGAAWPSEILAVTFTNKAAGEMRRRLEGLIGPRARELSCGTFHSICLRLLRRHAEHVGFSDRFVVYDEGDRLVLVKECLAVLDIDVSRTSPQAIAERISRAKDACLDPEAFAREAGGNPYLKRVARVYERYQARLAELEAMDFGDLIRLAVQLLETHPEILDSCQRRWRYILVDEYQDTNHAQYRLVQLLAAAHKNLCVVGDDDQCLVGGTLVTMGDGSRRPIEKIREGDEVLSCYGSGDFRPARVSRTFKSKSSGEGVALHLRSGRALISTAEHVHFAGYRLGLVAQQYFTYVMQKRGVGWRLGTSQVYTAGQAKPMVGFKQRLLHEHADALWVIGTHSSENEARAEEYLLSLEYRLPTIPFVPRKGRSRNGLVHDSKYIERIFAAFDTEANALRLLADRGLSVEHAHHRPRSRNAARRNVVVTLCGDRRGRSPMHRVSIVGNDAAGRAKLEALGFSVRPAKHNSRSWRFETAYADYGQVNRVVAQLRKTFDVNEFYVARLGAPCGERSGTNALPFLPAASVMPGMALFSEEGGYDIVERVERRKIRKAVYDLNVERTHNFIANGIVTHNSVYRWRGADLSNILRFEKDFTGATVVRLEQNYRSTRTILAAAEGVVGNNAGRKPKALWTENDEGERVGLLSCDSEHREAEAIARRITRAQGAGRRLRDVAVFYRTNAQSRPFEEAFRRAGIAYRIYGGMRFYERAEVKDVLAYLRLLVDPRDDIALRRIINVPTRGIGKTTVERLATAASERAMPMLAAIPMLVAFGAVRAASAKRLAAFQRLIEELAHEATERSLVEIVQTVLERSGYVEHLATASTIEAEARLENINELVAAIEEFEASGGEGTVAEEGTPLQRFLDQVALVSQADAIDEEQGAVTMMTLHLAKGLEFPVVFMVGMEEGLFPHARSIDDPDELEEERRLCYVGMTRAKEELALTHAFRRTLFGKATYNVASRFLDEIPGQLVARESIGDGTDGLMTPRGSRRWVGGSTVPSDDVFSAQDSFGQNAPQSNVVFSDHESRIMNHDPDFDQRPPEERGTSFQKGGRVNHPTLGAGVVMGCQRTSSGHRVTVRFQNGQTKRLIAEFAGLLPG